MSGLLYISEAPDLPEARMMAEMAARGFRVHVLLHPMATRAGELETSGVCVHRHRFSPFLDLSGRRQVRRLVQEHGLELVHALRGRAAFKLMMSATPVTTRRVAWCDDLTPLARAGGHRAWASPRLDRIIASCHAVRIFLRDNGVEPARISTIYKGVDASWYGPPANLREFNIPPKSMTIGYAGPLLPHKGVTSLAECLRHLPPEPRFTFLIVGPVVDERVPDFAARNRTQHKLIITGPRSDDAAIMAACDLFVMPSHAQEGLPRPLLEAMLAARPVIVTTVGGLPELVEHQNSGWVVRPGSTRSLAKAIVEFARDAHLSKTLGLGAAERVREKCGFQASTGKLVALYETLGVRPVSADA